ncbi:MAG TPA: sodium:proton antiporter [Lachnospiraceae bacterium]|nr:sodium:proton antiporter [Lachnospiraceae bacterium]
MDFIRNFPMFSVVLSLFSGVLCTLLSGKKARIYTIAYECVLLCMVSAVLWYTVRSGASFTYVMGEFPAPWGNELRAGVLEAVVAVLFMAVMLCSVLAGERYVKVDIDESKVNLFYAIINLMTAALMAMTWTNDVFSGYVFLEILTLTSCGVLIVREIGRTTLAAVRYMILNLVGSGLFLLGVVLLYDITGNLLMVPMHTEVAMLYQDPGARVVLIMATGILTTGLSIKSGLFPFHYWMPDTYGWATPTSAAVLSSLVSKCYIFLLIKIYWRVIGIEIFTEMPVRNILFVLGLCGMIFGSVSAIRAENINRMVAFSSAAQIGYIYMGIGLGGTAGFTAAVFHIMAHAVTKSQLFLTTPRLAEVSGDSLRFKNLQGCALRDPNAGIFFLLPSLSMIGIPIFAGFSSKLMFGMAAADNGGIKLVLVMLAMAASSMLNALYFIRTLIRIYTPVEDTEVRIAHRLDYNLPMIALTAANLAMGLFSWVFAQLIGQGFGMFA